MSIQVKHLTHIYSEGLPQQSVALEDVTFSAEDGQFVGIIGHTGSGKSTLVQHLNGILKPKSGQILVSGTDITAEGVVLRDIRKKIGLVFQYPEYQLFEETVEKDVAFGPGNLGLGEDEIRRRVKEAIELVGLDYEEIRKRSPFDLSGGQKRRVAIAGVIAMEPECIVLDEATAMLDPHGRREVLDTIHQLNRERGMTVVLITHHMAEAEEADRVIVMNDGEAAMDGTPREIFAQVERLHELGLAAPDTVELMQRLNRQGEHLPLTAITVEECADALYRRFGAEGK